MRSTIVSFALHPKNKSLVLQCVAEGLPQARIEDAVGSYEQSGNICQRCIFSNGQGIRSMIRFFEATSEKISALKAETSWMGSLLGTWNQRGAFSFCAVSDG